MVVALALFIRIDFNFHGYTNSHAMTVSQDLFVSEQHPVSRRWAIIEDDGRVAWLYLTEPDRQDPVADCWLYNRVPTPPEFESAPGQSPVVPQTYVGLEPMQVPAWESIHLGWSVDGESVAVLFQAHLLGFIAHGLKRGFSRHIRVSGPFGNVLDTELFQKIFSDNPIGPIG
jgi:hypothetical protein